MASDRERPEAFTSAFTSGRFEYGASAGSRFRPHLQIFQHASIIGVVNRCERLHAHCRGLGILHAVGIDPDQLSAIPLEIPSKRLAGRRIYRDRTFAAWTGIFYDVTRVDQLIDDIHDRAGFLELYRDELVNVALELA